MLNLINISKTYKSKSNQSVEALKNVNLQLPNKGMVFILGKSGSGKSTLLNLLGGLDAPTDGEIFVDGTSMQQFSQREYDTYRSNYVGFVFQEFNLLADFNVKDNVALALKLSKTDNVDAKVIDALRQVELDDKYLTRRIDEMSGGEKQRIAIARAIIKESKIVLADEPTGNLDSATGESIWNILKKLSDERLVVVVSHDRESAEKYADRIIEISDGQVIADGNANSSKQTEQKPFVATKQSLSFGTRFKMGYNNLKLRKSKTVSVILLTIFTILSLLLTQMCLSFSPELTLAQYMQENDVKHFTVSQGYISGYDNAFEAQGDAPLRRSTLDYIAQNSRYIKNGIIQSKQDILDMGLTFIGEVLEIDDDSYYATKTAVEDCYRRGKGFVKLNGKLVQIVPELHPIEFLIGKNVYLDDGQFYVTQPSILAGVIDIESSNRYVYPSCFYTENFDGIMLRARQNVNNSSPRAVKLQLADSNYDGEFYVTDRIRGGFLSYETSVILTSNGIVTSEDTFELADNEIVLSYELYAQFFDANSKWYYINSDLTKVNFIPQEVGQTFDLKVHEYSTGDLLADYGKVKLVGVAFRTDKYGPINNEDTIAFSTKLARKICADLKAPSILISVDSLKDLNGFVKTLRNKHFGFIKGVGDVNSTAYGDGENGVTIDLAYMAYDFEEIINLVSIAFLAIGIILLIILVLMVVNLISLSISGRKKEIGILSALGTSNGNITSIFLLETLVISSISFVITFILAFAFQLTFNSVLSNGYMLPIVYPFLRVDIVTVALLIATSFGLLLLAALIPIRKIIKLKPIDAIRNV